jgi:hypothetical protein
MYTFQNPPKSLAEAIAAKTFTPALLLELGQAVVAACSALRYVVLGREQSLDVPEGFDQCGSFMAEGPDKHAYTISPFLSDDPKALQYLVVQNLNNGQRIGVFTARVDKARVKAEKKAREIKWAADDARVLAEAGADLLPGEVLGKQSDGTRPSDVLDPSHLPATPAPAGEASPYWMYHQRTPVRFNARDPEAHYDMVLYYGLLWEINSPTAPAGM